MQRLRAARPPIIGRIENDALVLDLRTVDPAHDDALAGGLQTALRGV